MTFTFTVFGIAEHWRVRRTKQGHHYADPKMVKWQDSVRMQAIQAMGGKPLWQGAVRLGMYFYLPRPKSHYRTGKHAGELKENAPYYHMKDPDVRNLSKCLEDALESIVYVDDNHVAISHEEKYYGDPPRVVIEVKQL